VNEMGVLTQAMHSARELAMTRMEEEADQLGADGIVGVRLDVGRYEAGADMATTGGHASATARCRQASSIQLRLASIRQ
jgi:uncharacterized protein YbjQ (UPF0145 family)